MSKRQMGEEEEEGVDDCVVLDYSIFFFSILYF